jgi:molybdopterin-containing oxidoreductase family membrane subunit
MATRVYRELPYGIGRVGPGFFALVAVLLALIVLGLVAVSRQLIEGEVVTGLRNLGPMGGVPWGLYIVFVVYFVGVSFAGITVAALIRVLNLEHLRPVSRIAELLTVLALVLGAMAVLVDLGQPGRGIVNLFRYARPQSPFFGTFSLVISAYLIASMVYLYLDGRKDAALCAKTPGRLQWFYRLWAAGYEDTAEQRERHRRASWWLSLAIIPLLVIAHSTLGFVFGLQVGATGWYGAFQPPEFVVLAGVSGIGLLIVIAAAARSMLNLGEQLPIRTFAWLANFLWVLLVVYGYLMIVEVLTAAYQQSVHEERVIDAMVTGRYAWMYWLTAALLIGPFIALFVQAMSGRYSLPLIVVAGLMVNVAAIFKRFLIVVPSQTHGRLLPYEVGGYTPTWVEYSVVAGLLGLGALAFVLFFKVFPIMEVREEPVETPAVGAGLERG